MNLIKKLLITKKIETEKVIVTPGDPNVFKTYIVEYDNGVVCVMYEDFVNNQVKEYFIKEINERKAVLQRAQQQQV